ncbi:hypothetical protein Tco_1026886 [Tanacetum coccineum]
MMDQDRRKTYVVVASSITEISGEDGNYHEFIYGCVMEETYFTSPVMGVKEDLEQKHIHGSDETAMVLGSQGKSILRGIYCLEGADISRLSGAESRPISLKDPRPFTEGFRLSLQCRLPRRTWDPGIT